MASPIVTRFAPSPTGYLHLGHAYSALLNYDAAEESGGKFILRLEDIDRTRCRAEFTAAIYEDLAWLGLEWEKPVRIQSEHLAEYEAALAQLRERGLLYRCFKSRKDIEEAMSAPHTAPGQAFTGAPLAPAEEQERLERGEPYAWRLSMAAAQEQMGAAFAALGFLEQTPCGLTPQPANPLAFGDVVLGRKDSGTSYHLASVLDDDVQGVTTIIRGEELRGAAGLHALLYALFDRTPPVYRHHRMLTNEKGERLSKRDGALSIRALREAGWKAADIRAKIAVGNASAF
jgi:glutamyl-Q tRNA(Asp) synthetase